MEKTAEWLRRIVTDCGLSIPRLAEIAGLSKPTVYAILDGHEPRPATVEALRVALGRIATLLAEIPPQPIEQPGVDDLAADHQLLTALGVGEAELARVRALASSRDGALLLLAAVLAERGSQ